MQLSFLPGFLATVAILLLSEISQGQPIDRLKISKISKGEEQKAWIAELNNDKYKDLVVIQKVDENSIVAYIFLQTDSLSFSATDTLKNLHSNRIFFADINNSGHTDLIVNEKDSGKSSLTAFLDYNATDKFTRAILLKADSVSRFSVSDLNNDGLKDLLLINHNGDGAEFRLLLQKEDLIFEEANRNSGISDFLVTSLNGDGYADLALFNNSSGEMGFLTNYNFEKWDTLKSSFNKKLSQWQNADINHDGKADILITANSETSGEVLALINNSEGFIEKEVTTFPTGISFSSAGDFTNDGLYDISIAADKSMILQLDSLGDLVQKIPLDTLQTILVGGMGDIDDDGDLDWVGFKNDTDSLEIYLRFNIAEEPNTGPQYVAIKSPVTIGNQTTFAWSSSTDNKTPSTSLSYDFYIESESEAAFVVTSDYDLINPPRSGIRNISRHGYTLLDTLLQVNDLSSGKYYWGVAGVDIAYYSSTDIRNCNGNGPCKNEEFVAQCVDITRLDTLVCVNDTLDLAFGTADDSVVWSSVKEGFLASGNFLRFPINEDDEIYAIAAPKTPCEDPLNACFKNYSLSIRTFERNDILTEKFPACQDSLNSFTLEGDFEQIEWYTSSELLSDSNTVQFISLSDSLVFLRVKETGATCFTYDTLVLEKMIKPALDLLSDNLETCTNSSISIEVNIPDSIISEVAYTLTANGSPIDINNPTILVNGPISVIGTAIYANCHVFSDTLQITPSTPPLISVEGDNEVFPGESTVLTASGASHYQWSPPMNLSSPNSASTTATPAESTLYQVKGWDISGCEGLATFTVEVIPSVYIPELFTPNNDGSNDLLIIHGSQIDNLSFSLFDGNGRRIYQTSSVSEITSYGWDGTINGKPVAPGTYVWRLGGQFKNGSAITYNGKTVGELKIVR